MRHEILLIRFYEYIAINNPELLLQLESENRIDEYLFAKINTVKDILAASGTHHPQYVIEENCMDILTQDLRPSKSNYISNILQEDFISTYQQLEKSGMLQFEIINLVSYCQPVFDVFDFSQGNEDSRELMYAVTGSICEYLDSSK